MTIKLLFISAEYTVHIAHQTKLWLALSCSKPKLGICHISICGESNVRFL